MRISLDYKHAKSRKYSYTAHFFSLKLFKAAFLLLVKLLSARSVQANDLYTEVQYINLPQKQ